MSCTLVQNALIIDGTGRPGFAGAVMLEGGRIHAVIREADDLPAAETVIDVRGAAVAPGFIDMHSHMDWVLPLDDHPDLLARFVEQGVTTVVGGNCGISPAPVRPGAAASLAGLASIVMDRPLEYSWNSMAEFLDQVEEGRPLVNLAELAGHASIRAAAGATRRGPLQPDELDRCLDQAREALEQGACGLSFGLGYDPGMYSPLEELEQFFRVAAAAGKPVTVHAKALSRISPCYPVTYPGAHNLRALRELLELGRATGVRLQLSHFIFVGRRSWSTRAEALRRVDDARRDQDVMLDAFPYTCGNTTILAPIPYWFLARVPKAYHSRAALARLRVELEVGFRLVGFMYHDFQVMDAAAPGWEEYNGLTIAAIAERRRVSPFRVFIELAEASRGAALMLFHTYSGEPGREEALEAVLAKEYCLIETDAAVKRSGWPNPAALGAFPRVLGRLVRDRKLMSLEAAVQRMTGASADRFGLRDRGVLEAGRAADLVVFDPAAIADNPPDGARPAGRPVGVQRVFINGVETVRDGSLLPGVRPGRVVRG